MTGHIWGPAGCPGTLVTRSVPEHIRELEGSPGRYGHQTGSRTHTSTGTVHGHILAAELSLGTDGHEEGARAHMSTE